MHLPLIYADLHWSETSSIFRKSSVKYKNKYTARLEHLIDTVTQIEEHALNIGSDTIISLGDTFDKSILTAQELTALQEIQFNPNIRHIFLVGNHEISTKATQSSTSHLFNLIPNCEVIDTPQIMDFGDYEIAFLPYISEDGRKSVQEYFHKPNKYRLLLSHNDIKGIQMGKFISQEGFVIEDIEDNCDLCINGHLHNAQAVTNKLINIGNVCGQNFSEDASKYEHCYFVFDFDSKTFYPYRNPFALNFYKFDFSSKDLNFIQNTLNNLCENAILSIKVDAEKKENIIDLLEKDSNILEYRLVLSINTKTNTCDQQHNMLITANHVDQFIEYMRDQLGDSTILNFELQEISK